MEAAIVDLDGTVYRSEQLLPGAADGIELLREAGLDTLFFSNNPIKDGQAYAATLSELGIDATPEEACSAGVVTTEYLQRHHATDSIFSISAEGLTEQFEAAGLTVTDDPDACDVLVASWTPAFDYGDMEDALAAVDESTPFLGTDPDRIVPGADGPHPGSGAIIGSVAAVVGRDPDQVLGKPSAAARKIALDRLGVAPEECLVIGDRLDTDLALGAEAGMTTVLVLTGVTDRSDLEKSEIQPDYVVDSLGDIGPVLGPL